MLNRCINPICRAEFKLLGSGDFYKLELRAANREFFWICPECSERFDLSLDEMNRVTVRPRSDRNVTCSLNPEANLRLMAHTERPMKAFPGGEREASDNSVPGTFPSRMRPHRF